MIPFSFWNKPTVVSGFNPQTQGTLVNWYDASTLGLSNGASITSFTDRKTGNPNPLSTAGTAPTMVTGAQNGLSVASFNGTTQYLEIGGSSASTFPYTVAAVMKLTNLSGYYTILGASATGGFDFRLDQTTGTLTLNKGGVAGIGTSSSGITASGYHLVVVTVTSSDYAFYIDGTAAGSGSHSVSLNSSLTFLMGANNAGSYSELFNGSLGEEQTYNSVLSGGDLSALHTYAVSKWATP